MPHPIDIHVGERVRARRLLTGLSQDAFASKLGITFQQVQKYEKGANRISASRLYRISKILNVPVAYFFDDMDGQEVLSGLKREGLELVRAFNRIEQASTRKQMISLIHSLADELGAPKEPMFEQTHKEKTIS